MQIQRHVHLIALTLASAGLTLPGCTESQDARSGHDTLDASMATNAAPVNAVSLSFSVNASELKNADEDLEPACLAALEYQNNFERAYLQGKLALLDLMRNRGNSGGYQDSTTSTRLPINLTVTVGGKAVDLETKKDSSSVSEGGKVTAGGGSAGSGGAISVAAPQTTESQDNTDNVTLEFSTGATLAIPLSNQVQFTEIPADDTSLMTEAIRAFYRLPIYCNVMKKCSGFGIPKENFDTGSFCGGFSFSMGGGSGGRPSP